MRKENGKTEREREREMRLIPVVIAEYVTLVHYTTQDLKNFKLQYEEGRKKHHKIKIVYNLRQR